jgi:hypothetical protein
MSSGKVDPGLSLGDPGSPLLCLPRPGRTPWLHDPRPIQKQPRSLDATLRRPGQLVSFGQLGREALQSGACLIEVISDRVQGAH